MSTRLSRTDQMKSSRDGSAKSGAGTPAPVCVSGNWKTTEFMDIMCGVSQYVTLELWKDCIKDICAQCSMQISIGDLIMVSSIFFQIFYLPWLGRLCCGHYWTLIRTLIAILCKNDCVLIYKSVLELRVPMTHGKNPLGQPSWGINRCLLVKFLNASGR